MFSRFSKIVIICFAASALFLPELFVSALTPSQEREALEQELKQLEEEIKKYEQEIDQTAQEKKTLENRIYILKNTINKLDAQIYQSNIIIDNLGLEIDDTQKSIVDTTLEIEEVKDRLSLILRTVNEEDQRPLLGVLLSEGFSEFFENLSSLEALNMDNQKSLEDIKSLKAYLENQKAELDEEKTSMERQVAIQTLQRQENTQTKAEQDYLLKLTEAEYQKYLTEKEQTEKKAQEIRSRIFELIGVPEAPTFGEAVEIAQYVESMTGVRAPFLLAILYQESNIGKNVGQCYLRDTTTGDGVRVNGVAISKVMKPTRDVKPFLTITQELGRDWQNTPVSCPIASVGGYGGAMGPAQFIPSTWMIFKDRVADIKGSAADPWNIRDAFLASAVYLGDIGAKKQTYEYEWCAALSYFSGSCSLTNQVRYEFYGDSVMYWTDKFEKDIAALGY
jgi:membrane-bound lytic murein transglycosylase B/cell division protein FtsB